VLAKMTLLSNQFPLSYSLKYETCKNSIYWFRWLKCQSECFCTINLLIIYISAIQCNTYKRLCYKRTSQRTGKREWVTGKWKGWVLGRVRGL